jgi:hypothetical protein
MNCKPTVTPLSTSEKLKTGKGGLLESEDAIRYISIVSAS